MKIEAEHLSFQYAHGRQVLRDVSFAVEKGKFVSLLGPNGAGKSTLMKCMLGLLKQYSGEIRIDGENIRSLSAAQLARKVAYIPQSSTGVFHYTVREVVLMGTSARLGMFARPGKKELAIAMNALKQLHIEHLAERSYMHISGGERQLVIIARALAQSADILFMDEPASNLDYGNQIRVMEEIRELVKKGYTILQSTHNPDQAFLYSDILMALNHGTIAASGTPGAIITPELIKDLYGIDAVVESLYDGNVRVSIPRSVIAGRHHE